MEVVQQNQEHFSEVAKNTLDVFGDIASSVDAALGDQPRIDATALTNNTLNNPGAFQAAARQNAERERTCQVLAEEPAIARIVVRTESGEHETYFISDRALYDIGITRSQIESIVHGSRDPDGATTRTGSGGMAAGRRSIE
jgi:GTP cyclohydrolase III